MRGENRWRRRRLAATLVWLAARVGPFVLAALAAFGAARLVARPANPEALLWWLGIVAVGLAALHLLHGLATRGRAFAALLGVSAAFPSRPPRRAAIAWAMPDTLHLRQGLDELAVGAWTTEAQSKRAALVAAMWALDETARHPGVLWRAGEGDVGVRATEGDIPGLLQLLPPPSIHHRTVTAGAGLAAVALLLSSVTLGVPQDRSRELANRGRADVPSSSVPGSSQPSAPIAPARENPPGVTLAGPSGAPTPDGAGSAAPSPEPSATTSAPTTPASSPQTVERTPPPASRPVVQVETASPSSSPAPLVGSGGLAALDASAPNSAGAVSAAGAVSVIGVVVPAPGLLLRPAAIALAPARPATAIAPGVAAAGADPLPSVPGASVVAPSLQAPSAPSRVAPAVSTPSIVARCSTTAGDVSGATPCADAPSERPTGADEQPPTTDVGAAPRDVATTTAPPPAASPPNAGTPNVIPPAAASPGDVATATPVATTVPDPADPAGGQRG